MRLRRAPRPDVAVGPGERVLAWAEPREGVVLAGTRDAVYLDGTRLPWEQVAAADWDRDAEVFRLSEVGDWGEQRREHVYAVGEPTTGLRVIARRAPRGGPLAWYVDYDEGLDPADPDVQRVADSALATARGEVGEG